MGFFQARMLECIAVPFFRGSFCSRNGTHVSCIGRWVLYPWAIREAPQEGEKMGLIRASMTVNQAWNYMPQADMCEIQHNPRGQGLCAPMKGF